MIEGINQVSEEERPIEAGEGESFATVCENLRNHLGVLEEAFKESPGVMLPSGETIEPKTSEEQVLGKIQILRAHVEGYLEKNAMGGDTKDVRDTEKALRMVEESLRHFEQFLAIQADLVNKATQKGGRGAEDVAVLLRGVAHTLLSEEVQDVKNNT